MGFLDSLVKLIQIICGGSSSQDQQQNGQPVVSPQPQYPQQQQQQQPQYQQQHPQYQQQHPQYQQQQSQYQQEFPSIPQSQRPPQQQQQHRPPSHSTSPSPGRYGGGRVDQNQVNQSNEQYMSLRARANEEGDQMAQSFEQSHQAYASGNGALAKELSNKGKAHQREMERLNKEASEWIYIENNKDSKPGEIDLHGLYVKEAISYTERAIAEARQQGNSEIHLIVGKGLHSNGGQAKIKPAIEDLMQREQLVAELDPNNAGVLIVSLDGRDRGIGNVVGAGDLARGLESRGDQCIIM